MSDHIGHGIISGCLECRESTRSRHNRTGAELDPGHGLASHISAASAPSSSISSAATAAPAPAQRERSERASVYYLIKRSKPPQFPLPDGGLTPVFSRL